MSQTLYDQLKADPTLRVKDGCGRISQEIILKNPILIYPIVVRIKGLLHSFTEDGVFDTENESSSRNIRIYKEVSGTPHPYDFDNSAVVNGNIHCEPVNETLSIYED